MSRPRAVIRLSSLGERLCRGGVGGRDARRTIPVQANTDTANDNPQEQYEHINEAMRHLHRVDDRQIPSDVAESIENIYWTLDELYSRVDNDE